MLPDLQPVPPPVSRHFGGKPPNDRMSYLFQRMKDDDYLAFEAIFKATYRRLCAYAHQLVISHELAEEIVDDVFCNIWRNRKRIHITSSFQSYLIRSVRNRSLDCLRQSRDERKYVLEQAERLECRQSIASEKMIYEELCQQIDAVVKNLPEQCGLIFRMSRYQDLSYREIANTLKISIKTVDTQIGRALKSIRKSLASRQL